MWENYKRECRWWNLNSLLSHMGAIGSESCSGLLKVTQQGWNKHTRVLPFGRDTFPPHPDVLRFKKPENIRTHQGC
jgi:hypothetical protein